ncbi:MAG: hypothetical protein HN705_04195 [Rhodospirillales bacterium]|jgi:hypothetical protein|nr:hypothetical protein [Rhodospirillales bacterium]
MESHALEKNPFSGFADGSFTALGVVSFAVLAGASFTALDTGSGTFFGNGAGVTWVGRLGCACFVWGSSGEAFGASLSPVNGTHPVIESHTLEIKPPLGFGTAGAVTMPFAALVVVVTGEVGLGAGNGSGVRTSVPSSVVSGGGSGGAFIAVLSTGAGAGTCGIFGGAGMAWVDGGLRAGADGFGAMGKVGALIAGGENLGAAMRGWVGNCGALMTGGLIAGALITGGAIAGCGTGLKTGAENCGPETIGGAIWFGGVRAGNGATGGVTGGGRGISSCFGAGV